jgi:hypothetical protein
MHFPDYILPNADGPTIEKQIGRKFINSLAKVTMIFCPFAIYDPPLYGSLLPGI